MKNEKLAKNILIYLKTFAYYIPVSFLAYLTNAFLYANHIGKPPTSISFIIGILLTPIFIKPIAQYSVEKSKRSIKQQYIFFFLRIILILMTIAYLLNTAFVLNTIEQFLKEFN